MEVSGQLHDSVALVPRKETLGLIGRAPELVWMQWQKQIPIPTRNWTPVVQPVE
jgi:hypothetical protein